MLQRFFAFLLFLMVLVSNLPARAVDLSEDDKAMHAQACASISMISYAGFRAAEYGRFSSSLISFSLTMVVGHLKEASDPIYDKKDLEADAIGAGIGLLIPLSFTF